MKISTKFLVAAASAASIVSFALPASAVVYIGLQTAGVNGGAISTEASGANFATFADMYGAFELTLTTGTVGLAPTILGSTSTLQNSSGGGSLDVWVTRTDITGPVPNGIRSSFTSNTLTTGWSLTEQSYFSASNQIFGGTLLSAYTFMPPGLGTFSANAAAAGAGPYSVTQRYTITAPSSGQSLATISMAAVPEASTWALMIMGFGGVGVMLRSRRRQGAALA